MISDRISTKGRRARGVRHEARLLPVGVAVIVLLASCATEDAGRIDRGTDTRFSGPIWQFRCDPLSFAARFREGSALLITDETLQVLTRTRSASGARYAAADTVLWSRGTEAMLERAGERNVGCLGELEPDPWTRARQEGFDFRASGNEPGWYLELKDGGRSHLVADYGEVELWVPTPAPDRREGTTVYEAGDGLRIEVAHRPCRDSMRGDLWPAAVTVSLDGRNWRGCGMYL